MLFNSLPFLFAFLPFTYVVFWAIRSRTSRYAWLALTGYVFYAFWDWRFCGLMALSTAISFTAGLGLLRWTSGPARRACLVVPIVIDLLLLGFFKYADFAIDTANSVAQSFGSAGSLARLDLLLPVGISFYTFHTISYIVDCYRGVTKPTRNPIEFACYVSLFSQLVAGPIVRFREVEGDLDRIDAADRAQSLELGLSHFAIGLAKKVLIADTLAAAVDPAFASPAALGTGEAWACVIGYALQLYFDFSGYSDMAVGLGRMFGLTIPRNFDSPYKALDIADFWRRWHISLSTCIRDYVFIPLGGSRGSESATVRNLLLTMTIGGLWHGASWNFVLWGAYHGVLLVFFRAIAKPWSRLPAALQRGVTFVLVIVGWVPFRAVTLADAGTVLSRLFSWHEPQGLRGFGVLVGSAAALLPAVWLLPNTNELSHRWSAPMRLALALAFALSVFVIYAGTPSPFLYFQF